MLRYSITSQGLLTLCITLLHRRSYYLFTPNPAGAASEPNRAAQRGGLTSLTHQDPLCVTQLCGSLCSRRCLNARRHDWQPQHDADRGEDCSCSLKSRLQTEVSNVTSEQKQNKEEAFDGFRVDICCSCTAGGLIKNE